MGAARAVGGKEVDCFEGARAGKAFSSAIWASREEIGWRVERGIRGPTAAAGR